ncbi:MAG: hypothetical protein ACREFH_00110, partial [Stellaceae bacterium]
MLDKNNETAQRIDDKKLRASVGLSTVIMGDRTIESRVGRRYRHNSLRISFRIDDAGTRFGLVRRRWVTFEWRDVARGAQRVSKARQQASFAPLPSAGLAGIAVLV